MAQWTQHLLSEPGAQSLAPCHPWGGWAERAPPSLGDRRARWGWVTTVARLARSGFSKGDTLPRKYSREQLRKAPCQPLASARTRTFTDTHVSMQKHTYTVPWKIQRKVCGSLPRCVCRRVILHAVECRVRVVLGGGRTCRCWYRVCHGDAPVWRIPRSGCGHWWVRVTIR